MPSDDPRRTEATDAVASAFLNHASRFTRLVMKDGTRELTRTEAGLLGTLVEGSRRITELAETEALAQPTVTQLVDKLERRELVRRSRSAEDGRVVLVDLTLAGEAALAQTRAANRAAVRDALAELTDEEVAAFATTTRVLGRLLQARAGRE